MTLREALESAKGQKVAIGHFNVSNLEMLSAVFRAAKNLDVPVIIGVSEGERDFMGVRQIVALVDSIRREFDYPIFLNADHTYSFDKVKEAIDAGFDSVIYDGAKLSIEDNIKITKQCVEYARQSSNPNVLIEGELGYIGQSSKVLDGIPEGVDLENDLTTAEEAKRFVDETGVDMFAPAVGNIHGMMRGGHDPSLDIKRIKEIGEAVSVPLVLHGGSGNDSGDFEKAIKAGISIIHISTELRVAYQKGLKISLQENPDEVAPYKYLRGAVKEVERVAEAKLRLFNHK